MMYRTMPYLMVLLIFGLQCIAPTLGLADGDCARCHQDNNITVRVPDTEPITILADGKEQTITLDRAFQFHGHECPGMTTTFLAIRYGVKLLFQDEMLDRNDFLLTSISPAGGIKDMIDLVMKGDNHADRTWPPDGMKNDQDRFTFTMVRKSTSEAVDIRLEPELMPADFFKLQKKKGKNITQEEWWKLHEIKKDIILGFPLKSDEELFGKPEPYKVLLWGSVLPGEMDQHLRQQRIKKRKTR